MRAVSLRSLKCENGRPEMRRSVTASGGDIAIDFEDFLMMAIKKFTCPVSVSVRKEVIPDMYSTKSAKREKLSKFRRKSIIPQLANMPSPQSQAPEPTEVIEDHTLKLITYYDVTDQLVEIFMAKYHYQPIPRMLMQLIALKVPYIRSLSKFTIKQCRLDMYTVYELSKILLITNITEVCLDHSPLKEGNYDILLADASSIRNLSLSRCNVNDIVLERIAARLQHLEPAESTLRSLNLSSNSITDVGMRHLGAALRGNRHLQYLNLADNRIGDVGAKYIFDMLKEFRLTLEETTEQGKRYLDYLKKKHAIYNSCVQQMTNRSDENINTYKKSKKGTARKSNPTMKRDKTKDNHHDMPEEFVRIRAESMVNNILGPFRDPYTRSTIIEKDNEEKYSIGNFTLCYINFAYNNMTFQTVQELLKVVLHQKNYRNEQLYGLLYIILEGNYMPTDCDEYKTINKELISARISLKKIGVLGRSTFKSTSASSK